MKNKKKLIILNFFSNKDICRENCYILRLDKVDNIFLGIQKINNNYVVNKKKIKTFLENFFTENWLTRTINTSVTKR